MFAIGTGTAVGQRLEALTRATRGGHAHALDERYRLRKRKGSVPPGVEVPAHRP